MAIFSEKLPIKEVPRDGTFVIVGDPDVGEYLMRFDTEAENAFVGNVKGMWVAPDGAFTWDEHKGMGPTYWRRVLN